MGLVGRPTLSLEALDRLDVRGLVAIVDRRDQVAEPLDLDGSAPKPSG